jgi:hypothetical protein
MRLKLLLPRVEPSAFEEASVCPNAKCGGKRFHLRQEVRKPVRDTVYSEVTARRYACLLCGQTFRVYPLGISADQTSRRLKGLAVLFYIMGLSYGAVALVLTALGHPLGKTACTRPYRRRAKRSRDCAGMRCRSQRHGCWWPPWAPI